MSTNQKFDSTVPPELASMVAQLLGCSVEQLAERVHAQRDAARRGVERNNLRFAAALRSMSDVQALVVENRGREGYKVSKLLVSRSSERVAVMMQKRPVWDTVRNKMGGSLMMIYPDGTTSQTFERSISIRKEF